MPRKWSRYQRDKCPTCGSEEPMRRNRRYSTARPGRSRTKSGNQMSARNFRFGWRDPSTRPTHSLRVGGKWRLESSPATTRVQKNRNWPSRDLTIYVCNDHWHVRGAHDPAGMHTSVHSVRGCDLPGHEAPAQSIDTVPVKQRHERSRAKRRQHKLLQSKQRR